MKIHCPNFVPKSGCFYQISVKVCPKQLPSLLFKAILRFCVFVEIFAFSTKKSQ